MKLSLGYGLIVALALVACSKRVKPTPGKRNEPQTAPVVLSPVTPKNLSTPLDGSWIAAPESCNKQMVVGQYNSWNDGFTVANGVMTYKQYGYSANDCTMANQGSQPKEIFSFDLPVQVSQEANNTYLVTYIADDGEEVSSPDYFSFMNVGDYGVSQGRIDMWNSSTFDTKTYQRR